MGDLTKNISRHELACNCECGLDSMDWETINAWQGACDHFAEKLGIDKVTLVIHSAARCFEYNRSDAVGSNDNSQHPRCRAIDGHIVGVTPIQLYAYFDTMYQGKYGIGLYPTFVHLDARSNGPARW